MKQARITDPTKARAAVAHLLSEGWTIDFAALKALPGGMQDQDWLDIANTCMDFVMNELAKDKVIPIARFKRH